MSFTAGSFDDQAVADVFAAYPDNVRTALVQIRQWVFDIAAENDEVKSLTETLKWGQPSYLTTSGSTLRIDAVNKIAGEYALYFHCRTKLIATFREVYADNFRYDGNRALLFNVDTAVSEQPIRHVITLALTYHKVKHLPLLGA